MRNILIFYLLFHSAQLLAQPGVAPTKEVDGTLYYVHKVEPGNTLWGLQQMYGAKVDDIMAANPDLKEGLKVGQEVLVPGAVKAPEPEPVTSEYKVKKGETLYGLSRKFDTSVDQLIALNPELSEGLKKGQVIKVPGEVQVTEPIEVVETPNPFVVDTVQNEEGQETATIVTFSDSTVRHTVMQHETMYKISKRFMVPIDKILEVNGLRSTSIRPGQVLIIPVKQERIEHVQVKPVPGTYDPNGTDPIVFEEKERYKIAVLLPLHLDYGPGYNQYVSQVATQFYMGAQMAIDSLRQKGLNADVHYFDTQNDTTVVQAILNKPELEGVDMIIGPFFKSQEMVANYCKENKVRMVCPVKSSPGILEGNRLVYSSVPSNITLIKGLARYILKDYGSERIILIKPTKESDMPLYEAFRNEFNEANVDGSRPALIETTVDGMKGYMTRSMKNVFVVPTVDKNSAMRFMNSLNKSAFRSRPGTNFVFGTKEWIDFQDVNNVYKNKYNFHYAGPNFIDYYTDEMVEMNKLHRKLYKTDLSKMAVQGYDIMTYYCSDFFLNNPDPFLLMNDFQMKQISDADGYENSNAFIIEQDEFELFDAEKRIDD